MKIEFYEKEKQELTFGDLSDGEFFTKHNVEKTIDELLIWKKTEKFKPGEYATNAIWLGSVDDSGFAYFEQYERVRRVEIKKIVIDVDW